MSSTLKDPLAVSDETFLTTIEIDDSSCDSLFESSSYTSNNEESSSSNLTTSISPDFSSTLQSQIDESHYLIWGPPDTPFTPTPPDSKPVKQRKSRRMSLKKLCQIPFSSELGMALMRNDQLDEKYKTQKLKKMEKHCMDLKESKINRRSKLLLKKMKTCKVVLEK